MGPKPRETDIGKWPVIDCHMANFANTFANTCQGERRGTEVFANIPLATLFVSPCNQLRGKDLNLRPLGYEPKF